MIALVVTITEEGGAGSEQHAFIKSPVRIGRGEINDLPLRQPFVSTFHALVQFDDQEAFYIDLGSLNGSLLNGEKVSPNKPVPLGPDAQVRIPASDPIPGTFKLTFERKPVAGRAPSTPRQMTAFAARAASLVSAAAAEPAATASAPDRSPTAVERPPPSPPVQPPEPEVEKAVAGALDAAAIELDLSYTSFRGAWEYLRAAIDSAVANLRGPARQLALERLAARYPGLSAEPQFLAMMPPGAAGPVSPGVAPPERVAPALPYASAVTGSGADALRLLRAFCESYLPVTPDHLGTSDIEAVLGRVASAVEAFARSFIELRRGYEEFGKDMGVRTVQGDGALQRAGDARQLLAYVLDPRASGRDRELQRAFADFMIHQVALLRGVTEGAQALMAQVSPERIAARAPQSLWPMRAQALWKAFEERYHEIADEEGTVSEILFGKEFARAYFAMAGQRGPEQPRRARRDDERREEGEEP